MGKSPTLPAGVDPHEPLLANHHTHDIHTFDGWHHTGPAALPLVIQSHSHLLNTPHMHLGPAHIQPSSQAGRETSAALCCWQLFCGKGQEME